MHFVDGFGVKRKRVFFLLQHQDVFIATPDLFLIYFAFPQ